MFCAPAPEAAWYVIDVIHSTSPARNSPPSAIIISETVQLPPMKSRTPARSPASITSRLTGSRMMTASSFMRSAEAASIQ